MAIAGKLAIGLKVKSKNEEPGASETARPKVRTPPVCGK
jgi:hypothetical protein